MMFGLPSPWVILAGVVVVGVLTGSAYMRGRTDGGNAVTVKVQREDAERALKAAENVQRSRDTEQQLQASADAERARNAGILQGMSTALADTTARLQRERAARADGAKRDTSVAGVGPRGWIDGRGLYADDAVFLTRFADTAQRVRMQRDSCYVQYNKAETELEKLRTRKVIGNDKAP